MPEFVTIPISFFELQVDYEQPQVRLLGERVLAVQGIFDALKPWNPGIDDIEVLSIGKSSEQGVNFKLPLKRVSFFVGPSYCKFTRDDADWETSEETTTIVQVALAALVLHGGVTLGTRKTVMAMHLQPRSMAFIDILKPFLSVRLAELEREPVRTMATVAKWDTRKITIDGSGALANGLFLRLERDFEKAATLADIAAQLRRDEEELFGILGIEEDRR